VPSPSQRPPPGSIGTEPESISRIRDPAEIHRLSFERARAETDLTRLSPGVAPVALRLVHALGDPSSVTQSAVTKPCG
jgi:precorrin isomerase